MEYDMLERSDEDEDAALSDAANVQCAMATTPHIKAIQQRVQFTAAHRHGCLALGARPDELLLLQALTPQT
jgi:hypothetical protein